MGRAALTQRYSSWSLCSLWYTHATTDLPSVTTTCGAGAEWSSGAYSLQLASATLRRRANGGVARSGLMVLLGWRFPRSRHGTWRVVRPRNRPSAPSGWRLSGQALHLTGWALVAVCPNHVHLTCMFANGID